MKLHQATGEGQNLFTGYGDDHVQINRERHDGSLIVTPDAILAWDVVRFEELDEHHFQGLLDHHPEVVILGTGATQRFPHPRLSAALAAAGVGMEVMDTRAACRTYNILLAEGRKVIAAILA